MNVQKHYVFAAGKLNGNFIEGMACKNGCTGGAASMCHAVKVSMTLHNMEKLLLPQTV